MSSPRSKVRWLGTALACVVTGFVAGAWEGSSAVQVADHAESFEALSEAVLAVCLFGAGLKLSGPADLKTWRVPLRLALITLPVSVALIAGVANVFLGIPIEQALLLGAILGPTDPVLASNLELPASQEGATRFALSAEGALGSCLALPLVLFALGLNGDHDLGPFASRWIGLDLAWGLGCGAGCGWLAGRLAVRGFARFAQHGSIGSRGSIGLAELAVLAGTLALACGAAFLLEANEFAAALAAGAAVARAAVPPLHAVLPPKRTQALAVAAARIERFAELAFLIALGALLAASRVHAALVLFALLILIAVRPVAAGLAFGAPAESGPERRIVAWFAMRGVGSMYYLMFAIDQSVSLSAAGELIAATVSVLAISIALHAVTALPLGKRPAGEQG
jgi:sodium/hydrogen antiporter